MKSTTKLQLSIIGLSSAIIIAVLAYFSFAIPQFNTSTNTTTPASPATYSLTQNYSFQINFTNAANTTFQLGSPSGSLTNYTDNTTGLVGYWRLNAVNGTNYTKDASGYGNDGKYINVSGGALPAPVAGKIGNALQFDGVNDYVDTGNGASLNITNAITIEAWVNRQTDGVWGRIVAKSNTADYDYWLQTVPDNSIGGGFVDTNGIYHQNLDFISGNTIPLNKWTYIVFVYDGTYLMTFFNGVLDKSVNIGSFTIRGSAKSLWIGRLLNSYNFNGTIDEVRIYNRSLSAAEISTLYNMQYPYYAGTDDSLNGAWAINFTQSAIGGAGAYNYTWFGTNATGGQNSSQTVGYVINKLNNVSLSLAINGTQSDASYTYGVISNATAWSNSSAGSIILYRNGTNAGNPENNALGANVYNYTAAFSHENYSANQVERTLTINTVPLSIIVSPQLQTITYGTSANQYCSNNNTAVSCLLYRNSSSITNNTNIVLGAAVYNYTANITDTQNYTVWQNSSLLTINKAATLTRLFLNGTEGNKNYNMTNMTQTANITVMLNISGKTVYLDTNLSGWSAASGATPLYNYTQMQSAGIFNITGYFIGDENYSASSVTYFANVISMVGNISINLALHLGSAFADDSLQNGNNYDCIQDSSGWFGLTSENPQQAQSGNMTGDYRINVSFTSDSKAYLALGRGGCANFRNRAADAQNKRFLSPLISFSYATTNLIQLILQFNATDIINDAHWGKGAYLLSIANQGYNSSSAKQNLAIKVVK